MDHHFAIIVFNKEFLGEFQNDKLV